MVEEIIEAAGDGGEEHNNETAPLVELKPKMQLTGTVTRLELYGAFIDIGASSNAILHVSKLGKRVNRVEDALTVGDSVSVWIESVDAERDQVTLTMVEPLAVDWSDLKEGQIYKGTVVRLEKFGAFVDIGAEKEGLVHISELSHEYVKHPSEAVKPGEEISVSILGFSKRKRRIDLSRKALLEQPDAAPQTIEMVEIEEDAEEEEDLPTAMEIALRRAMGQPAIVQTRTRRSGGKTSPRQRGKRKRKLQEDILSRTLNLSKNLEE